MNDWYERSMKAFQLNGQSQKTQECYTRSVRMLVEHYDKTPDLITEEELQEYFLYRKNPLCQDSCRLGGGRLGPVFGLTRR